MNKTIKKIIVLGVLVIMCVGLFTGCGDAELKQGTYVTDDGLASVRLYGDSEFIFNRGSITSYRPTGNYSIKKRKLILHVTDNEEYIFNIKDGQLVFVIGNAGESLVGAIFKLSEKVD